MAIRLDEEEFERMKKEEPPCITCRRTISSIDDTIAHTSCNRSYITGLMQHTCRSCEYGLPITFDIPGVRENTSKELTEAFISAREKLMSKYTLPMSILREIFPIINEDALVYVGSKVTILDFADSGINLARLNPNQIKRMIPEILQARTVEDISIVTDNNKTSEDKDILYRNNGRNIIRVEYQIYH